MTGLADHTGDVAAQDSERPWRILELFARDAGLDTILTETLALLAERCPSSRSAALLFQNGRLRCLAGCGIPAALQGAFNEPPADAASDSPEAAAPAWVTLAGLTDLATDDSEVPWRSVALAAGLSRYWSEPIRSAAGEVLGVLIAFLESGERPPDQEAEALRLAARIAGIAIEQKNVIEELYFRAHHDPVTFLPNRYLFEDRLKIALPTADRAGAQVALLHIDLDRFHTVNDLLGRSTGDHLLEMVARRLEPCMRSNDTLARTAGDEFCGVLAGVANSSDARLVGERIRARLAPPFALAGNELTLTASIGYALYPLHAPDAGTLERCAAAALYRAKQEGRNCVREFVPGEAGLSEQRARIENALGRAIARDELRLAYQPQVDLRTMALAGAEALLRWQHPIIGLVSPGTFIPIAEKTGLIVPIGRWVLRQACKQAAAWRQIPGAPPRLAVNVSAVQLAREEFVEQVAAVLKAAAIPGSALELELTETALASDVRMVARRMADLKALGVALAIDDFGTGYSSLAYLQELPVDTLKIDISFVRQIAAGTDRSPVIESIISMARALGKKVIAEGVETLMQQTYLAAVGCDMAQGYLYSRPVDPASFAAKWMTPG